MYRFILFLLPKSIQVVMEPKDLRLFEVCAVQSKINPISILNINL